MKAEVILKVGYSPIPLQESQMEQGHWNRVSQWELKAEEAWTQNLHLVYYFVGT